MPLQKFAPVSPDPSIQTDGDMTLAKFGHLNSVIDYINTYVAADSLQLEGTGSLSATPRYITDAGGNLSSLAISTGNVGIGTNSPVGKVDIVSDGGGQFLFSRYGGQPQINIRRSQGTFASPTTVVSGASSVLNFQNYDGTSFGTSAQIQSVPETQTPTSKGASLALNVVQSGTTSLINGLIVSSNNSTPGSVSISTNFGSASARLSIWQTTLASTLPYFNIVESGGGELLKFSNSANLLIGSNSPSDTAKVSIKGSGSTSATTSLLVQNNSGMNSMNVADDGVTTLVSGSTTTFITLGQSAPNSLYIIDATGYVAGRAAYRFNNLNGGVSSQFSAYNLTWVNRLSCGNQGNTGLEIIGATGTPNAGSAVLALQSTTQGFLPPRMTTAEKLAIPTPSAGLMVYDTDLNKSFTYDGTTWQAHW